MALDVLQHLEAESIHILREVAATCARPVMLYSIGKDSAVMLHLARKAFHPGKPPFPLLHVDTTWKFKEMIAFRDRTCRDLGLDLIVHVNEDGLAQGVGPLTHGSVLHTDVMKTQALKQALDRYRFDAAFGGARRNEEKSRAKRPFVAIHNLDVTVRGGDAVRHFCEFGIFEGRQPGPAADPEESAVAAVGFTEYCMMLAPLRKRVR